MRKKITLVIAIFAAPLVNMSFIAPLSAQVQKCQDAQGKWHYGKDLSGVCKNEGDIKSVKDRVKGGATSQGETANDQELARLELKVLNLTEYLNSDLKKLLAPYNTRQDVDARFDRLKTITTTEIQQKETIVEGLEKKQNAIKAGSALSQEKSTVELADISLRIKSNQADIRELNIKSTQIDQRRAKVLTLFDQFKARFRAESNS